MVDSNELYVECGFLKIDSDYSNVSDFGRTLIYVWYEQVCTFTWTLTVLYARTRRLDQELRTKDLNIRFH